MSDANRIAAIMDAVFALTAEISTEQTGSGEDRSPRVRALSATRRPVRRASGPQQAQSSSARQGSANARGALAGHWRHL
jgi:hypothetical protein